MKLCRTVVLFDQGSIRLHPDWEKVHSAMRRSIERIDFPQGSGRLVLRRKAKIAGTTQWLRNGVSYLKTRFLEGMVDFEKWEQEAQLDIESLQLSPVIGQYPDDGGYTEPVTSAFGGFDFRTKSDGGLQIAIEWETGNISSSHRSLNKLAVALSAGLIHAGILIVPSRDLYEHLTDRIGNIGELSPYLHFWSSVAKSVGKGLLAIAVVEQDELTSDPTFSYLPVGRDGRSAQGKKKLAR